MPINAHNLQATYELMSEKLGRVLPDFEIRLKAELVFEINRLKQELGAVILGHNYMEPALFHTVPDVVGDSLELARVASKTTAELIVFCGVRFMAETAKILNPNRTVLLPARKAGCSLAASITPEDVRKLKARFPGVPVVTYINTYADVKAECDVVCTSGNADRVIKSMNSPVVIFIPDEYLTRNVSLEAGRRVEILNSETIDRPVDLTPPLVIGWQGRCEVHERFTPEDVHSVRSQFPEVAVLAHPECPPEVVAASDFSASTSKMVTFVKQSSAKRFLLLTECSMADNILAENPDKEMVRMCSIRCQHMNEITLEDTLRSLRNREFEITVPAEIAGRAKSALDRMLAI